MGQFSKILLIVHTVPQRALDCGPGLEGNRYCCPCHICFFHLSLYLHFFLQSVLCIVLSIFISFYKSYDVIVICTLDCLHCFLTEFFVPLSLLNISNFLLVQSFFTFAPLTFCSIYYNVYNPLFTFLVSSNHIFSAPPSLLLQAYNLNRGKEVSI